MSHPFFLSQASLSLRPFLPICHTRILPIYHSQGFAPFGTIVDGFDTFARVFGGYAGQSKQPNQSLAKERGNAYFETEWPELTYIVSATVVS